MLWYLALIHVKSHFWFYVETWKMSFSLEWVKGRYGECVWKGEGGLQTQTSHLISEKMEFVQWYAQLCFSLVFVSHVQIWPVSKILRRVCAYWYGLRGILEATVEGKMSVNHLLSRTRQRQLMGESTTGVFSLNSAACFIKPEQKDYWLQAQRNIYSYLSRFWSVK